MDCRKCKTTIEQCTNDYFECDSCWAMYHVSCVGVKKGDVTARKSSKFLKLYCDQCYADPGRVMAENIQKLLQYVMKIDMTSQKQAENNKSIEILLKKLCDAKQGDNNNNSNKIEEMMKEQTERIKVHIDECGNKLHTEILKCTLTAEEVSENVKKNTNQQKTYASVVSGTKSLIVRANNKDNNSEKTKQMLMSVVDPTESGVNGIKTLANGDILIKCNTDKDMALIERQVNETEGENYTVKEVKSVTTKVKLVGMTKKYSNEELKSLIQKQHPSSEEAVVRVIKVYEDKNTQKENFNAILELDKSTAECMLEEKKISIAWDMCRVYNYVQIMRCYKCLGYNHMAQECKNKIACCKCGGEHKVEECKSEEMSCVNCVSYAKKNNEDINTKHHAFAHDCFCTEQIKQKGNKRNNRKE